MFEIKDADKYAVQNDVMTDIIRNGTNRFFKAQNEIVRKILADLSITEQEMIAHGSKEEFCGATRLFYKDQVIAVFYTPEFVSKGDSIKLTQSYRVYK